MGKIKIIKNSMVIECTRKEFFTVDEVGDGIILRFSFGVFTVEDIYMPNLTKKKIKTFVDGTKGDADIIINLNNYNSPISITMQ